MMLANLYRKAGQERSAVTSYKEVLRQCPLALDAIIGMCGHRDPFIHETTFNLLDTCTCLSVSPLFTLQALVQKFCLDFLGRHATPVYKSRSVSKRCFFPLGLLSLSVKGAEVASMTMDVIQSIPNLDWLSVWVKAYAFIHAGDNQRAINTIW